MDRRLIVAPFAAATATMVLASVALAHGDHDARPLARQLDAGPYSISLWQVYPDAGDAMTPHLIVMFDGVASRPAADVSVTVNEKSMHVRPSTTTATGWETMEGVAEGDTVAVAISEGGQTWQLDPLVVPPPPTSLIPMQELLYLSIFLTIGTAWWVVGRTARAWRRPAFRPG
jgi:hypothetical protein